MDEQIKLAFEFASDLDKQLITLSTGILALTITFTKDILGGIHLKHIWLLLTSWIFFLFDIIFGIWCLMALTGTLAPVDGSNLNVGLTLGSNVRLPSALQILTFVVGVALIIAYGILSLSKKKKAAGS